MMSSVTEIFIIFNAATITTTIDILTAIRTTNNFQNLPTNCKFGPATERMALFLSFLKWLDYFYKQHTHSYRNEEKDRQVQDETQTTDKIRII